MKNILLLSILFLFITSCDGDMEDEIPDDYIAGETMRKDGGSKGSSTIGGMYYSMDSVSRYVITTYNERTINDIAVKIVESLIKKKKVFEYDNALVKKYGFELTKDIWDSLKYYNYDKTSIGKTGDTKEVILYGISPYKERDIWEHVIVHGENIREKHPTLFKQATDIFFKNTDPKVSDLNVENQGGNFVEYNAKIRFNTGNEQYIRFSIMNKNERLVIDLGRKDVKVEP